MRGNSPQALAFLQGCAHQGELVMLEIAQRTVDQLGRGRGGAAREIAAFEQQHLRPAPGGIARDPAAVDAAADHREVVHRFPPPQRMARPAGFEPATTSLEGSCRSEEHTSELQSLMRISYAVFCLKKKITKHIHKT